MAAHRDKIIAALDVGSTKVCCFIARLTEDGGFRVIGIGHQVSTGIKSGVVVDMEETETSIRAAVDTAERMAGLAVDSAYVAVTGGDLASETVTVDVSVAGHEIGQVDMQHALDHGRAGYDADGRDIIHAMPVAFSVDGAEGVRDPRGLIGDRLSLNMHLVSAAPGPVRNLEACVNRGHLKVAGLVAAPYASGLATLVEDEKALGTIVVDMGGGTTSIAVFLDGALVFTDVVPVGGHHVTNDIARGLLTPIAHAERMKTLYGSALAGPADDREVIDVPQLGEADGDSATRIPRSMLVGIIRPRIEETFELVRDRLVDSGFDKLAGRRLVLTGGASQLSGVRDLAGRILDKRVRIGQPSGVSGLADLTQGPAFASAVGVLIYATSGPIEAYARPAAREPQGRLARVGRWLRDNF
ncbi:MAG: cell division protein FtsA [Proteobacteria bacterium]|jgi:cell division protein FtsA|nr:MAG: cell division protein FtsA [Pseudomonadota bacterium]